MASESRAQFNAIWPSASWAIDSEPIQARGIIVKYYANPGGCYAPWPSALVDGTLLDLHNSSYYPTQPHINGVH